jgi:hypothetical protein
MITSCGACSYSSSAAAGPDRRDRLVAEFGVAPPGPVAQTHPMSRSLETVAARPPRDQPYGGAAQDLLSRAIRDPEV